MRVQRMKACVRTFRQNMCVCMSIYIHTQCVRVRVRGHVRVCICCGVACYAISLKHICTSLRIHVMHAAMHLHLHLYLHSHSQLHVISLHYSKLNTMLHKPDYITLRRSMKPARRVHLSNKALSKVIAPQVAGLAHEKTEKKKRKRNTPTHTHTHKVYYDITPTPIPAKTKQQQYKPHFVERRRRVPSRGVAPDGGSLLPGEVCERPRVSLTWVKGAGTIPAQSDCSIWLWVKTNGIPFWGI